MRSTVTYYTEVLLYYTSVAPIWSSFQGPVESVYWFHSCFSASSLGAVPLYFAGFMPSISNQPQAVSSYSHHSSITLQAINIYGGVSIKNTDNITE